VVGDLRVCDEHDSKPKREFMEVIQSIKNLENYKEKK
jgi:hypothetical protein